jgi:hypothetical protein
MFVKLFKDAEPFRGKTNLPRTNMTFLLTELGAPFTAAGFGN